MVLFFLALLALASSPPASAAPITCAAEEAAFEAARERFVRTDPEARERALGAAQALAGCPGATADQRARAQVWAAYALGFLRRYEEQIAMLDAFIADPDLHENPRRVVWAYDSRRRAYEYLGRPLYALAQYHTALAQPGSHPPAVRAGLMLDLALLYSNLGEHQQQLRWVEEALALLDPAKDPFLYSRALVRHASAISVPARRAIPRDYAALRRAEALSRDAIAVAAREPTPALRLEALQLAYNAHADLLNRLGEYEGSLAAAEAALRIAREANPKDIPPQRWRDLGTALIRLGRYAEGIAAFEEALRLSEASQPEYVANAQYMLGWGHALAGQDRIAERHFRLGVAAMEARRLETGLSVWNAQAFSDAVGYYQELAALLLREGRAQEAFEVVDASRARLLRDLRRYARLRDLSPADRAAHNALRDALSATYDALRTASPAAAPALSAQATRLEAALARISVYTPTLEAPPLSELQGRLAREDRVLLSYFLGQPDDHSKPPVAFVVTGTSFAAVPLPVSHDTLAVWVHAATAALSDPRAARTPDAALFQRLYDVLFRPVEHLVPEGAPVTVVPEGPLHTLPFGMLLSGPAEPFQYHAWPYLLHRNPLSTALSAALLAEPPPPPARRPLVAFGRSRFAGATAPPPFSGPPPSPLPFVPAELAALRRHVPAGTFALDEAATPEALRAVLAEAHVLHFASHTYVSAEDPLSSALLLYGRGSESGALYLHEIVGRPLAAALVVLSGCESALGQPLAGEGISGLHSAFQAAGARATLATLWAVDDAATAQLMDALYRHLARGLPKDRALQQAQLDYLRDHDRLGASPFFWAGVTLSGDPDPLAWSRPLLPPWAWLLLGGGLIALALAAGRLGRRHPPLVPA